MKADLYTKSVLTVIAVALCAIAFQNVRVIPEAQAQSQADMERAISRCWDDSLLIQEESFLPSWRILLNC